MKRVWLFFLALAFLPGMAQAQDVPRSELEIHPLLVGSVVPDADMRTFDDEEATLHTVLGESSAVLIFYRGGW